MSGENFIYSFDIGGTSVKHAIVNPNDSERPIIHDFEKIELRSRNFDDLKNSIIQAISNVSQKFPHIKTIAISTTGGIDDKTGVVINAGHFDGYSNISWHDIISSAFPKIQKVFTANDGKASAWAEFVGLKQDVNVFVHFVVGTGIGGATIVNKSFIVGDGGYAGYLGHIKIVEDKTILCSCNSYGCVETMASARAIVNHFKVLQGQNSTSSSGDLEFVNVVEAVHREDNKAIEAVKLGGYHLGKVIAVIMNILNPGVITIGGGVVLAFNDLDSNIFVNFVEESARLHAHRRVRELTVIKAARYGNDAGMIGAAQLAVLGKLPI